MYKKDFNVNIKKYTLLFSLFSFFCVSMAQGGNSDDEGSDLSMAAQIVNLSDSSADHVVINSSKTFKGIYIYTIERIKVYASSQEVKPDFQDQLGWNESARTLFGDLFSLDDLKQLRQLRTTLCNIRNINQGNIIVDALCKAVMRIEAKKKRSVAPDIPPLSQNQKTIMTFVSNSFNPQNPNYFYPQNRTQWDSMALKIKSQWDPKGVKAIRSFRHHIDNICRHVTRNQEEEIYNKLSLILSQMDSERKKLKNISHSLDKSSESGPVDKDMDLAKHYEMPVYTSKVVNVESGATEDSSSKGISQATAEAAPNTILDYPIVSSKSLYDDRQDVLTGEPAVLSLNLLSDKNQLKRWNRSSSDKLTPEQPESNVLPSDTSEELSSMEATKEAVSTKIADDLAFVTFAVPSAASADESFPNLPSSDTYEIRRKVYNEKRAKVIAIVEAYISSQELPTDSQGRQECARTLFGDLFRFDDMKEMMCLRNMLYILFKSNKDITEYRLLSYAVKGFETRLRRQNQPNPDSLTPTQREIVDFVSHSLNPKNQYDWLNLAVKVKNFWDPKGSKDINFLIEHIHKICNYLTNTDEQRIYFSLSHAINFLYGPSVSKANVPDLWKNMHSESLPVFVASESKGVDGLAFAISGSRFIRTAFPVDERYLSAVKSNTCNEVSTDLILGLLSNKNLGKRAQREEEDISSKRARTK
jgi:hypothetical protein